MTSTGPQCRGVQASLDKTRKFYHFISVFIVSYHPKLIPELSLRMSRPGASSPSTSSNTSASEENMSPTPINTLPLLDIVTSSLNDSKALYTTLKDLESQFNVAELYTSCCEDATELTGNRLRSTWSSGYAIALNPGDHVEEARRSLTAMMLELQRYEDNMFDTTALLAKLDRVGNKPKTSRSSAAPSRTSSVHMRNHMIHISTDSNMSSSAAPVDGARSQYSDPIPSAEASFDDNHTSCEEGSFSSWALNDWLIVEHISQQGRAINFIYQICPFQKMYQGL